jgi:hypothetical protein
MSELKSITQSKFILNHLQPPQPDANVHPLPSSNPATMTEVNWAREVLKKTSQMMKSEIERQERKLETKKQQQPECRKLALGEQKR